MDDLSRPVASAYPRARWGAPCAFASPPGAGRSSPSALDAFVGAASMHRHGARVGRVRRPPTDRALDRPDTRARHSVHYRVWHRLDHRHGSHRVARQRSPGPFRHIWRACANSDARIGERWKRGAGHYDYYTQRLLSELLFLLSPIVSPGWNFTRRTIAHPFLYAFCPNRIGKDRLVCYSAYLFGRGMVCRGTRRQEVVCEGPCAGLSCRTAL